MLQVYDPSEVRPNPSAEVNEYKNIRLDHSSTVFPFIHSILQFIHYSTLQSWSLKFILYKFQISNSLVSFNMKSTMILALASIAIAAPTRTIENRQLSGLGTSSGLGALESLFPGLSGSSSSSDSSSSLSSGLDALKGLIPGLSSSSSGTSSLAGNGLSSLTGLSNISNHPGIRNPSTKGQFLGSGSSTENGVTQNAGCKEYTLIFARGTTELGNMGSVIGPPLATQLNSLTGDKVTVQGVDYPADAAV